MRILFTSSGRRVELIQAFRNAAKKINIDLKIFASDISLSAPSLYFADEKIFSPRISDPNYIPFLLDYAKNNQIDCIIPTIDTDLLILSKHKQEFKDLGINVLISSTDKIEICRDKRYTSDYFISLGLKAPTAYSDWTVYMAESGTFPAFIKPKDGSSSINAFKVNNVEDLQIYAEKINEYVVQSFISGKEYTVDIFCDLDGNPVYITPRERMVVRAGEVLKTKIVQDDVIISEMEKLISNFNPCGPITVQLIRDDKTGEDYYIEINPRFGGGAPLSMKAGADSAEMLIRILNNENVKYVKKVAVDGLIYSRFDQSVCVNG